MNDPIHGSDTIRILFRRETFDALCFALMHGFHDIVMNALTQIYNKATKAQYITPLFNARS